MSDTTGRRSRLRIATDADVEAQRVRNDPAFPHPDNPLLKLAA